MGKLFKGLSNAAVSSRLPEPTDGVAHFLIDSMRMRETRDNKDYVAIRTTCVHEVEGGGARLGDRYGFAVFSGDYFLKELKGWILAMVDLTPADEDQVVEMMAPAADYPKMEEDERADKAWELIAQQTLGLDEDDKPLKDGAGMFDGQVVIQIESKSKEVKPKEKVFIEDPATGKMIPKPGKIFVNHYPQHKVAMDEVAGYLTDKQVVQFFGSEEKFTELLKSEG